MPLKTMKLTLDNDMGSSGLFYRVSLADRRHGAQVRANPEFVKRHLGGQVPDEIVLVVNLDDATPPK